MQNPEVWSFSEPQPSFNVQRIGAAQLSLKQVEKFHFNHLVSVVLPDSFKLPDQFANVLVNDCEYYKILDLNLAALLGSKFRQNFIKKGKLILLSIGTRIDCDNCCAITPTGSLILSLTKDSYQRFGLDGKTMPKFRDVRSLKTLSLKSVGSLVVHMTPTIISKFRHSKDPEKIMGSLQRSIDRLNETLVAYVPYYLHETMAVEVLEAVKVLIEKKRKTCYYNYSMSHFLTEMNVLVSLTEVVLNHRLRNIDFSRWPKIMRYVLYKNLGKMSGLEVLNLGSCTGGWRTSEFDKYILDGIRIMRNLRSICLCFDCSDLVIQTVSENCPFIQSIDVTSSGCVTDRSIPCLLNCKQLKELQLHRTSVSVSGLAKLISGLPRLQNIGKCDEFRHIIVYIYQSEINCGPFELRNIQTRDLSTESLRLLVEMFPKVEYISLFHDMQVADLSVLVSLVRLRELKLLSCAFYGDSLKQLLEIAGRNFTHIHLEHVEEMDFNVLGVIGNYCPKLKSLVFYNCDLRSALVANNRILEPLQAHPFYNLERIFWVVDSSTSYLEFILSHAVNIRYIHLGSSSGITHSSMVNILRINPMKHLEELRVLYSSDMNMRTVELLLASCTSLKVLSELESWQGISIEELNSFRHQIKSSNFDLDISPTLSFSIVTIDLTDPKLVPEKPFYKRTRAALQSLEKFNVIINWEAHEESVCPSSVAKFFFDIGYKVKLCAPKFQSHIVYSVNTPTLDEATVEESDVVDFVEWLGMVCLDGHFSEDLNAYANQYTTPEPNVALGQVRTLQWRGFFHSHQIMKLIDYVREFNQNQDKLWSAVYVQGFSDAPVIEAKEEQSYYTNGDNGNICIFKKSHCWFCKFRRCAKQYK
ncbi:hypothetical protein HUJ05_004049 [Dendroctonus ponderosae]|nr:hypothetical protein HUJ05_004049 [Dendroctonus ponderosae]